MEHQEIPLDPSVGLTHHAIVNLINKEGYLVGQVNLTTSEVQMPGYLERVLASYVTSPFTTSVVWVGPRVCDDCLEETS